MSSPRGWASQTAAAAGQWHRCCSLPAVRGGSLLAHLEKARADDWFEGDGLLQRHGIIVVRHAERGGTACVQASILPSLAEWLLQQPAAPAS